MEHDGSKKQKRVEKEHSESFWMLIVRATSDVVPNFHMVEVNKEEHKEIYEDLKMFEKEDLEIRMDFVRYRSPFINLKSKSRNYATQENYEQSEECKRWENFCCDCTSPPSPTRGPRRGCGGGVNTTISSSLLARTNKILQRHGSMSFTLLEGKARQCCCCA